MRKRIVLDANVFASGLMNPNSVPGDILKLMQNGDLEIVISNAILDELKRILFYPKVRKRIKSTDQDLNLWVESLLIISHFIEPQIDYPILVDEDPDDDIYLIAAKEDKAKFVISGDKHLLKINEFSGIKIIAPADFLKFFIR
jgi:putative PIN family toxin of toxin-antitoxin system